MMSLDAGEVFIAGRYNSLIPIMQEAFDGGFTNYYAVAVVKQGTIPEVTSIRDLRGKKACFSEVGSQAGWTIPIYTVRLLNIFILQDGISKFLLICSSATKRGWHGNCRLQ